MSYQALLEALIALAPQAGILLAAFGLLLNAYATLKNIRSRKLLNYQEIIKSHRELWKLTLDDTGKFSRILVPDLNLCASPVSPEERRFVSLLLLHMTSAFYFAKHSDIVRIEKLREDVWDVMSMPIPRAVWLESRHYFNRDFVKLIERPRRIPRWARGVLRMRPSPPIFTKRWRVLVLTTFPDRLVPIVEAFGDTVLTVDDLSFDLTPQYVRKQRPDLIVCFGYGRIIAKAVLRLVRAINIHTSLLPLHRGPNPNLWSILEQTTRGVSIHYIDEGVDTGDLIAQRELPPPDEDLDTLQSAFDQSVDAALAFFTASWAEFRAGRTKPWPQPLGGSRHSMASQAPLASILTDEGLSLPIREFRQRALTLLKDSRSAGSPRGVASPAAL